MQLDVTREPHHALECLLLSRSAANQGQLTQFYKTRVFRLRLADVGCASQSTQTLLRIRSERPHAEPPAGGDPEWKWHSYHEVLQTGPGNRTTAQAKVKAERISS